MTGIAIVGLACEYPDAHGPEELWDNVLAGRRTFRRIPRVRLDLDDYGGSRTDPDRIYSEQAAVLDGWELDRVRFRIAGSTYRAADPAHWLALDVAARALEAAGFSAGPGASREASPDDPRTRYAQTSAGVLRGFPRRSCSPSRSGLPRETTGVIVGNTLTGEVSRARLMRLRWPYVRRVLVDELVRQGESGERIASLLARLEVAYKEPFPETDEESLAGGLSNTIAGRIANHFDLGGGAFTVDGACASSLLSVCQACTALAAGDLDVALAGGVDLSLDPFELVGFARTGALAPGKMYVYDERSAGFIPGEGCGFVVLMREEEALERELPVLAVVRGWGISSDGAGGITRPEASGQQLALERAYRRAGFSIDRVGCFEGHGTGTTVGDAVELEALGTALTEAGASPAGPVPISSIKALIGHTKAAAGAAALIKATLAVHRQVLPPHVGGDRPHPLLTAPGAPLVTLPKARAWPRERPLVAAVSAMGFGGINTHVVLEAPERPRRRSLTAVERGKAASMQDAELLLLASEDAASLARQVERLRRRAPALSLSELTDLAAALARELPAAGPGRRLRAAVVAGDPKVLAERLDILAGWVEEARDGEPVAPRLDPGRGVFLGGGGRRPVGFLFPGQASPARLGGGLWTRRFEEVEELYRAAGLPTSGDGVDTRVAQPAIVTAELAGLALLDRLGIAGDVAVGHSLGELTALAWAGAWDEAALLEIARARGEAMAALAQDGGAMAGLEADGESVATLLADVPGVHLAGFNSPRQTVVSGPAAAVEAALERAKEHGLEATRLKVSHAFHSPLVAAAAPAVSQAIAGRRSGRLGRPVVSTVTGELLPADADLAELLGRQVTSAVRFTDAVAAAQAVGVELWIEVGPGRVLSGLAEDAGSPMPPMLPVPVVPLDAGGESLSGLLTAAGAAFALGAPLAPEALFEGRVIKPFDLDREPRFLVNPCELAPPSRATGEPGESEELPRGTALQETARPPGAAPLKNGGADPFEVVRGLVAERSELPPETVTPETRLLSDLHLSSISVGQLVGEASRRLGVAAPASPTDYADASVGELARVLAEREAAAPGEAPGPPAGLDAWVRVFAVEHRCVPEPSGGTATGGRSPSLWTLVAPPGHPLAALEPPLAERLAGSGRGGVALVVDEEPGEADVTRMLDAARAVLELPTEPEPPVLLVAGEAGGGFARTLHLEHPQVAVVVADLAEPDSGALERLAAEVARASGYRELRIEPDGSAAEPFLVPLDLSPGAPAGGALPLATGDLLLVTGGGKGIGAECALAMARATGAKLLLLGRSTPEEDGELADNLERMAAAGLTVRYVAADVLDEGAVARAVREAEGELGPVRGVLHGAGFNHPRRITDLTAGDFVATLAPKLTGLDHVLAAVDPSRLLLLVTFGSIIARLGLSGEADYATANDWLARRTARFASEHPSCRCLCLEWSVWSGVGMGERLGTVEALRAADVTPITPEVGVEWLLGLLAAPAGSVPAAVVVAGRFGLPPTLRLPPRELPFLRFLDRPRVHYPGVELVADVELSADTDPYLAEHELHGERLFPAVLGLEAMVQAAMAVAGTSELPVLEDVRLTRPVVVPPGETALVRLVALAHSSGVVEVALRTAATAFAVDHFRARCDFRPGDFRSGAERSEAESTGVPAEAAGELLPLSPAADLYGSLLFQQGRFRRLVGYRSLFARECTADVAADGAVSWFALYLPGDLLLGDPGARDAVLHGIQASIPHAQVLPVGVERLWVGRLDPRRPHRFVARERWRRGDDFLYDVDVLDDRGRRVERWQGLALRAVERLPVPAEWRVPLLGPYLERCFEELAPGSVGRVLVERATSAANGNGGGRDASDRLLVRLTGGPVRRRPDGKPEAGSGVEVSLAHASDLLLGVAGSRAVGCDVEPVAARTPETWGDLLGAERAALARLIGRERGEELDAAATRVWAAVECLRKAGASIDAPLVLATDGRRDGWLLLSAAGLIVGTLLTRVEGVAGPVVLALAGSRVAHEVPRSA